MWTQHRPKPQFRSTPCDLAGTDTLAHAKKPPPARGEKECLGVDGGELDSERGRRQAKALNCSVRFMLLSAATQ
jgi:hypothetical protein